MPDEEYFLLCERPMSGRNAADEMLTRMTETAYVLR